MQHSTYYNDYYLALLTADVYREMMFSRYTMELCRARRTVKEAEASAKKIADALQVEVKDIFTEEG